MELLTVESYAGSKAEEHPLRLWINKREIEVISIKSRWLTPEGRYFKVVGDDGRLYVLGYNGASDTWNLLTINRP